MQPVLVNSQSIPVSNNRFQPLNNLTEGESVGLKMHEQKTEKCDKAVVVERTTKKRILIVGDSHTEGMATEMQRNLEKNYVVQGTVKSGADLEVILRSNMKESMNLTKKGFLIIWGGTIK
jgi:hypothetical protein